MTQDLDDGARVRQLEEFRQETRRLYDMKEQAFRDGDPTPIVDHFYAPDAVSAGEGFGVHAGAAEFRDAYKEFVSAYTVRVDPLLAEVSGDVGYEWVNFRIDPKDGSSDDAFSLIMLFTWKRSMGEWRCKGEVFVRGELGPDHFRQ